MGKVAVAARVENLQDVYAADKGLIPPSQVRKCEVPDALVETGATMLSLPSSLVAQLGLTRRRSRSARTTKGPATFDIYDAVQLTVEGRQCVVEAAEVPDGCPVLIGQIPLEALDFVVDPAGQRLLGNPSHGGEQMIDMFSG